MKYDMCLKKIDRVVFLAKSIEEINKTLKEIK